MCLLPPAALPATNVDHLVSVRHGDRTRQFVGRLHIDNRRLELAASSLFGIPLFTISFDGGTVRAVPMQKGLPANLVVVVLETALADPARLRPHLTGLTLDVSHSNAGQTRILSENGREVARIERSNGPLAKAHMTIHILPAHTTLTLTPLETTP